MKINVILRSLYFPILTSFIINIFYLSSWRRLWIATAAAGLEYKLLAAGLLGTRLERPASDVHVHLQVEGPAEVGSTAPYRSFRSHHATALWSSGSRSDVVLSESGYDDDAASAAAAAVLSAVGSTTTTLFVRRGSHATGLWTKVSCYLTVLL